MLPAEAEQVTVVDATAAQLAQVRPNVASLPAVQAAAAAAGGFVAGAAVVGLVGRRQRRAKALAKGAKRARLGRRVPAPTELLQIVGSRSLLLDVHLLGPSGADR